MPARRKPVYSLHKTSGQARVRIDGREIYLGVYGSPESRDRYNELVTLWAARHPEAGQYTLTVDELALAFLRHAETHYVKQGRQTSEVHCIRAALRFLVAEAGTRRARDFSPKMLKAVRERMIDSGAVRTSINAQVKRIRRAFRWAVSEELIPVAVLEALRTVDGLREGRSKARESTPVGPVPEATVDATLPHLPPVLRDMVRVQLLTGCRPGEVCGMRPRDITVREDGPWVYVPESHKTQHRGRERRIFIGPQTQSILRPYLSRDADAPCFSPVEAVAQVHAAKAMRAKHRKQRRAGAPSTDAPKKRTPGDRYDRTSYCRAIVRGCEAAFAMPRRLRVIPKTLGRVEAEALRAEAAEWRREHCWSPNQLRHTRATEIRERFGIEAAQVVLGHSEADTTQIYAERDFEAARTIMREIG